MTLEDAFWTLHEGLPRQAPGSESTSRELLRHTRAGRQLATAIDIGCGPGRSTLLLASAGMHVTAVDTSERLLDQLRQASHGAVLGGSITIDRRSMDALDYPAGTFDLLWAESSVYAIGWQRALSAWRPLVHSDGAAVITDLCWLNEHPATEAHEFWSTAYPTMTTVTDAVEIARREGYAVEHTMVLPDTDWWDEYYGPLEQRMTELDEDDDDLRAVANEARREIEIRRLHGADFGYVGFILRPWDPR